MDADATRRKCCISQILAQGKTIWGIVQQQRVFPKSTYGVVIYGLVLRFTTTKYGSNLYVYVQHI